MFRRERPDGVFMEGVDTTKRLAMWIDAIRLLLFPG
jgi:hypothetical protein